MKIALYNTKIRAAKRRIFDSMKRDGIETSGIKQRKLITLFFNMHDFHRPIEMRWQDYIIQLYELGQLPEITPRKKIISKYKIEKKDDNYRQKYLDYLKSSEWRSIRDIAIQHWGSKCVLCCSVDRLQGHHRTYINLYHETVDDIVPLCYKCHKRHHEK